MKKAPLSEVEVDLSNVLREAETREDVNMRRFDHDARFLRRIEQARESLRAGRGVRLEDTN